MKIDISNLKQTESLGKQIGEFLVNFNGLAIFYLDGNLGTGKTTLVREILKAMSWQGAVKSPTFSILEEYQIANKDVFHFVFYLYCDYLIYFSKHHTNQVNPLHVPLRLE